MRYIAKREGGYSALDLANLTPPETSQEASLQWRKFGWKKKELLKILLNEQHSVCCYSEVFAGDYHFFYHIEHVLNKSQYPLRTFEYGNLAASALSSADLAKIKSDGAGVAFGGHAPGKSKSVNAHLFISPHQRDCARFFAYLSDGSVVPAEGLNENDKVRATHTIDELNLNSQFLKQQRKSWFDELSEVVTQCLNDQTRLDKLSQLYLRPNENGLMSFYSLTRQVLCRVAGME
jgi:uncharacterized protein (TIGR02646 family)